ncbi:hypothetical protein [Actinoplanes sp. CA-252034]|uniref:hypothetical protein n=1 Tax=Actinoplanes sp. CA-252034 TaxID=3239906 RepID=UPI003D9962CD
MTDLIELAVPCRVLTLEIVVAGADGLSTLEGFVARAVLLGVNTSERLAKFFAVPERVIVDVVGGLWTTGLITIDPYIGTIEVSEAARERLVSSQGATPTLDLPGVSKRRNFLFEPATGIILPEKQALGRPNEGAIRLPLVAGLSETDIPREELVRSVQTVLRRERRSGATTVVRSVSFGNPLLRGSEVVRWLHVLVESHTDLATGQLWIVPQDHTWDGEPGRRLRDHVSALARRDAELDYVRQLTGRSPRKLEEPERLAKLLDDMTNKIKQLAAADPSLARARYDELVEMSARIQSRITDLDRTRAAITPVSADAGHDWAVADLIDNAQRQLVLIAPMLEYPQIHALLPHLKEAIGRGVRLVVMWGRSADDKLPSQVLNALNELQRDPNAVVLLPERSSRTQACVVIQDNVRALVGSRSPLDGSAIGRSTLSVLVEPSEKGPLPVPAITDLLIWARQHYPYWRQGRRIMLHRHEFDPDGEMDERQPIESAITRPEPVAEDAVIDRAAIEVWVTGWRQYHTALTEAAAGAERVGPAVQLINNGGHISAFWSVVRSADQRLVIADDRFDPRVATADLADTIRARHAAGARTLLLHPPATGGRGKATTDPFSRLPTAGSGISVQHGRAGCRAVVTSTDTIIGSMSPLGDAAGGQRISQVSLHLQGREISARIGELLGAPPIDAPHIDEPPIDEPPAEQVISPEIAAGPALLHARAAADRSEFGNRVVDRLGLMEDPWRVLDIWADAAARTDDDTDGEIRLAVAALVHAGVGADLPSADRWRRWLVVDAWERREFVEAALLAQRLPQGDPLRECAVLDAALEVGPLGPLMEQSALCLLDADRSAQAAGAAGVIADILLYAGIAGVEVLQEYGLLDALTPAWRRLADEVVAFHGRRVGPLPLPAMEAAAARADRSAAADADVQYLRTQIAKLRKLRNRFNFDAGTALHDGLFSRNGLLNNIGAAAAEGREAFADLRTSLPVDVKTHMNDIVAAANEDPFEWHKHVTFLQAVQDIVRTTRALADDADDGGPHSEDIPQLRVATDLGRYVDAQWDQLFTDADTIAAPYHLPVRALLDRLTPLRRWIQEAS